MAAPDRGRQVPGVGKQTDGQQRGRDTDSGSGDAVPLPVSSAQARARVLALLEGRFRRSREDRLDEDLTVIDALLVTSELVTNAHRHGGGLTRFTAVIEGDALHVTVGDANPAHPVSPPAPAAPAEAARIGGYGWQMVLRLARTVTVASHSAGKTISAVVALTPPAGAPRGPVPGR